LPGEKVIQTVQEGLNNNPINNLLLKTFIEDFNQQNSKNARNSRRRMKSYLPLDSKESLAKMEVIKNKALVTESTQPSTSVKADVILPIGTSGSGKSTFIKSLPQENLVVIEPDAMRVEFTGDINDKSKDKEIYIEAAKRAVSAIKQGKQVVFDTTNLTKEKRRPFIKAIKKALPNANIQYKLMELNPELAKQRIKAQIARGEARANVSDATIDRHAESYKQMLEDIKSEDISNYDTQPTVQALGFQGYKGGFENKGKGTPQGDGKDKAMRKVADGFIGELSKLTPSSTLTSASTILKVEDKDITNASGFTKGVVAPSINQNANVIMLARNGGLSGQSLKQLTKDSILDAHNKGASFVVGDMVGVDSQFIDYLQEIGAKFTIYHTGTQSRIQISQPTVQAVEETFEEDIEETAEEGTPETQDSVKQLKEIFSKLDTDTKKKLGGVRKVVQKYNEMPFYLEPQDFINQELKLC